MNCINNVHRLDHIAHSVLVSSIYRNMPSITEAVQEESISRNSTHSMFTTMKSLLDFLKLCREKDIKKKGGGRRKVKLFFSFVIYGESFERYRIHGV